MMALQILGMLFLCGLGIYAIVAGLIMAVGGSVFGNNGPLMIVGAFGITVGLALLWAAYYLSPFTVILTAA